MALKPISKLLGPIGERIVQAIESNPIIKDLLKRISKDEKVFSKADLEKYLGAEEFSEKFGKFSDEQLTDLFDRKLTPKELDLAFDPARGRINLEELNNALKAEEKLGIKLKRNPVKYKDGNPQKGADFIDVNTGKTYDDFGTGPLEFLDEQLENGSWENSLIKHLEKSDFTIIDLSKLKPSQAAKIQAIIQKLPKDKQSKILFL